MGVLDGWGGEEVADVCSGLGGRRVGFRDQRLCGEGEVVDVNVEL